ncbi:DUF4367 domain-containing protein [Paucisalibacillus sp. EB02]|uniref:DUF4367 domain-containing protein n=1 Tax=Paucisalibacillus sp. EB02 TaxID=1347087 RepID=UPI0004B91F60|nr:DUF4367 domain-containing protein [Paucisalibacillus sp. EB02]
MNKKILAALLVLSISVLSTSIVFAFQEDSSNEDASASKITPTEVVSNELDQKIDSSDVKNLMPNVSINQPKFIPEGMELKESFYNEPPSTFANSSSIDKLKEVKFYYSNNNEQSFTYVVKEADVSIASNIYQLESIKINDVEGELLEIPEKKFIVISFRDNEVSHRIEAQGIEKDAVLKIAESIN